MTAPSILRPWRAPGLPALLALAAGWWALTPSLLPRSPLFQGVLCAVSALLGYGAGALLQWIGHSLGIRLTARGRRWFWRAYGVLAIAGSAIMLWLSHLWQQEQRHDIGMEASSPWGLGVALVSALAMFAILLILARAVRGAGRRLGRWIGRLLPKPVAAVVGALLVAWALVALVDGIAVGRVAAALDRSFLAVNDEFVDEVSPPAVPELSAGPGSAVSWAELGRQGRVFIANAPTAEQVAEFRAERGPAAGASDAPTDAFQPIRVYVGGGTDGRLDLAAQADTAVDELVCTGAFERSVLNVVTGTGRGWVNENQARALEFMWDGDTATVSMQYSYLPSWMSYLVDAQRAREAGRALFEAVYAHWDALPTDARPLLVVSGESLGSYGSEGAFGSAQDLASRIDGALYVGPTANNVLWSRFTRERDAGTPEHLPVYDGGAIVRFSADGREWAGDGAWAGPRVGYVQHANDPVTWLDFGSTLSRPDWMGAERGPGVPDAMVWAPVITVMQLAVDQLASGIPYGQGHEFGQAPAEAWAKILPPDGWSEQDTARLADTLAHLRTLDIDSTSS